MKTRTHVIPLLAAMACAGAITTTCPAQDNLPVRIMPLGDSITEGCCSDQAAGSYRNLLYTLLVTAGYTVDFVGTETDAVNPDLPDRDHQGMDGFSINQIADGAEFFLKKVDDPDVILLHVGTNDFWNGELLPDVQNRLRKLLARLCTLRPHAKVIVSSLILRADSHEAVQAQYGLALPQIVSEQVALGRRVSFVDLHAALLPEDLMPTDWVHPKGTGFTKMAQGWLPAITSVIAPTGSSDAPAIAGIEEGGDLEHVKVRFSKPLEDAAATTTNFSLNGGLSVLSAELDSVSKRIITLTTAPQSPATRYTLTVTGVRDRTAGHVTIAAGATGSFTSHTVSNGGFENGAPDWTAAGDAAVVNSATLATRGTKLAVFGGAQLPAKGSLVQSFPTQTGRKYRLSCDVGASGTTTEIRTMKVSVTGSQPLVSHMEAVTHLAGGRPAWAGVSMVFVADGSLTQVRFEDVSTDTGSVDLMLDDVRVEVESSPDLLFNGSFETGSILPGNFTTLDGWTIVSGDPTGFISAFPYVTPQGKRMAAFSIDDNDFSGAISQGFATVPGTTYTVTLDMGVIGAIGKKQGLQATVTGDSPTPLLSAQDELAVTKNWEANWSGKMHSFTADGTWTILTLSDAHSGSLGTDAEMSDLLLDNVKVVASVPRTVVVTSTTPGGTAITASPADLASSTGGTTPFSLSYQDGAVVALNAPAVTSGLLFRKWQKDGFDLTIARDASVTIDGDHVLTAVYGNDAPVGVADRYVVIAGKPLDVPAANGVLANDVDESVVVPLVAVLDASPSHGTLTWNTNGGFNYQPTPGYTGQDSFIYHASDGDLSSNPVTVTLSVIEETGGLLFNGSFETGFELPSWHTSVLAGWTTSSGDPVGFISDFPYVANHGSRMALFNVDDNDFTDVITQGFATVPGTTYTVALDMGVIGKLGKSQGLQVTVTGDAPLPLLSAQDELTVTKDWEANWTRKVLSFTADGTWTTLALGDTHSVDLGTNAEFSDLLLDNVKVVVSNPRTITVDSPSAVGTSILASPADLAAKTEGATPFSLSYQDGTVVTLTAPATAGSRYFKKWRKDGVDLTTSRTATWTVEGDQSLTAVYANDAPMAVADRYVMITGSQLDVPAVHGVLANDLDESPPSSLTAVLDANPTHGTLTWNSDGSFIYQPSNGYVGEDSFTYHAHDGESASSVATVTLAVIPETGGLLVNGSFEAGFELPSWHTTTFAGWTTASGDPIGFISALPYVANHGSRMALFSVDDNDFTGVITQGFATVPGATYTVTLDMGVIGALGKKQGLQVTVKGASETPLLSAQDELAVTADWNANWAQKSHSFTADSTWTTLSLGDAHSNDFGSDAYLSDLLLDNVRVSRFQSGFGTWMTGFGLTDGPAADTDGDSISNAVEYVTGGNPKSGTDSDRLPNCATVSADLDGNPGNEDYMLYTFRRSDLAHADPTVTIWVAWATDLSGTWVVADTTHGEIIQIEDVVGADYDLVKVHIPRSLAPGGAMFARLCVSIATP